MEIPSESASVVARVRQQDGRGIEDLYALISGLVPAKAETRRDDLHEVFLIAFEAIRRGDLREPGRLTGFLRTVARRRAVAHIRGNIADRRRFVRYPEAARSPDPSPEEHAAHLERDRGIRRVLKALRGRDRDILIRFYIREQRREQICAEMGLTATQFRLLKSRALARCARCAASLDLDFCGIC